MTNRAGAPGFQCHSAALNGIDHETRHPIPEHEVPGTSISFEEYRYTLPSGVSGNGIPTVTLRRVPPVLNLAEFLSFIIAPPNCSLTRVRLTSNICDAAY